MAQRGVEVRGVKVRNRPDTEEKRRRLSGFVSLNGEILPKLLQPAAAAAAAAGLYGQ